VRGKKQGKCPYLGVKDYVKRLGLQRFHPCVTAAYINSGETFANRLKNAVC